MMRELGQMLFELAVVKRFERCADPLVHLLAPLDQYRVVGDFLGQRVLEGVFDVADRRLLVDELADLQVVEQSVEFVIRLLTTARINDIGNSRPMTASVCSRSLSSAAPSMRAARMPCTVGGIFSSLIGR